jgi:hypothetical protein
MESVTPQRVADYLAAYVRAYRTEYERFVGPPPKGGGYPRLAVSPYLYSQNLICYMANDGYAVADFTHEPAYQWEIAGGPALLPDFPESRTPAEIIDLLKRLNIYGKPIGIYRIVAKEGIDAETWTGALGSIIDQSKSSVEKTSIRVQQYKFTYRTLIRRLTFGAFDLILPLSLPDSSSAFWKPFLTRDLGFVPADRNNKRFFHYLELSPHLDLAAWDERTIPIRTATDVRRDFAHAFSTRGSPGGFLIKPDRVDAWIEHFHDRLQILGNTIHRFQALLEENPTGEEAIFHDFLQANPIVLDVYGEIIGKPKFVYPDGESPLGKVEQPFFCKLISAGGVGSIEDRIIG